MHFGLTEEQFRARVYMAAVCRCFPGKAEKGGDRVPSPVEIERCSRHMAAASITKQTKAIAIVVSESAIVRIFDNGKIIAEIIPEIWLLQLHSLHGGLTPSEL